MAITAYRTLEPSFIQKTPLRACRLGELSALQGFYGPGFAPDQPSCMKNLKIPVEWRLSARSENTICRNYPFP
jgi:hypothetical protein